MPYSINCSEKLILFACVRLGACCAVQRSACRCTVCCNVTRSLFDLDTERRDKRYCDAVWLLCVLRCFSRQSYFRFTLEQKSIFSVLLHFACGWFINKHKNPNSTITTKRHFHRCCINTFRCFFQDRQREDFFHTIEHFVVCQRKTKNKQIVIIWTNEKKDCPFLFSVSKRVGRRVRERELVVFILACGFW